MNKLDIHEKPIVAIAYLESNRNELVAFIRCYPEIYDDYNEYLIQDDDENDDYCDTLAEYIEYYYWPEFVKYHNNFL